MKKLLLLTLSGVICTSGLIQAQKIKREVVGKYSYTQLPSDITLKSSTTYKIVGHGDYVDSYEKDKMSGAINLSGFEKKDRNTEDVDFKIDIEKYAVKFGNSEQKTSEKTTKKDGVETKTKYYHYEVSATYKFVLRIYKDGEEVYKKENAGSETISGNENKSSSEAYKNFKSKKSDYLKNVTTNKVKAMNSGINEKYCTLNKTTSLRSAHLKPKKHKYDDYDSTFEEMKQGYLIVAEDENAVEEAKENLLKAIEGFKVILKESDPDNKKARINEKITALLYNNIGHCYFMMKEYVPASENYTKAMNIQKLFLDVYSLNSKSIDLNKRVEANKNL